MDDRPFGASAAVYDLLYDAAGKDYASESAALHELIQSRRAGAASLLDVACGTGAHLEHLRDRYDVAGVDLSAPMLEHARARLPGVTLVEGDMRTFDLGRPFDAITCLFSAIAYMHDATALDDALANFARHLAPRGVVIIDGWIRSGEWRDPGIVHALASTRDGVAGARVGRSSRRGNRTTLELHHLVGTLDGVEYLVETHELTLFSDDEYRGAFERAGLSVDVVESPHPERDRYVGVSS
jgi:SAM-dependent methyltransferase